MSDENLINVEDETPEPAPVAEAVPEAPVVEAAAPEVEEEIDLATVDPKDEGRVRGLIAALAREREKTRSLKPLAERAGQIEEWYRQHQPYVDVLKANPDLFTGKQKPQAPPQEEQVDPDVVEYAQTLQIYKADGSGQLDLKAAAKLLSIAENRAEKRAKAAVEPMQQQSYQQRSQANFQSALQIADSDGNKPNPRTLQAIWRNMPVEYTADPQVAGMLAAQALGLDSIQGRQKRVQPPGKPALDTESGGGEIRRQASLTDFEKRVAASRGIKPETYAKLTEGFKAGRTNVIEED
jgi:hypothetical protein